jgi:hypothetical protein
MGMTDAGAAGLMGNLEAESSLMFNNAESYVNDYTGMTDAEYTAAVDSGVIDKNTFLHPKGGKSQYGYGLAQWTYWSRKKAMLEFHQAAKKSIGDLQTQLAFLVKELSESYKSVWTVLKTAKTVAEASNAVLLQFERPADQSSTV